MKSPRHNSAKCSRPEHLRHRLTTSFKLLWAASAVMQAWSNVAYAIDPASLPTPCAGGACGAGGDLPFVGHGQIGHGGMPEINGHTMTVRQLSEQAILNWKDFNIGADKAVVFDQPSVTASTLNRVWGPDVSTIAGQLRANGQVYLINQNGVLFANGAQVDVGGLVASTLNIKDSTYLGGLLTGNTGVIDNTFPAVFESGTGFTGNIEIKPGAILATANGGRIMLLAPTVTNQGKISTPDGQAILGAGKTVYLAASSDPALRGLLIEVDAGGLTNSTASNQGTITAERGNITLAGLLVNQSGRLTATTSVNANGSIQLSAGDVSRRNPLDSSLSAGFVNVAENGSNKLLPNQGGTLTMSHGSVTEIIADATDKKTVTDAQVFLPSAVSLVGKEIALQGSASIIAPGGNVSALAADNPYDRIRDRNNAKPVPIEPDGSRIYLDTASRIDASGLQGVQLSAERNLVQVELRSNELQDAPLQRNGFLKGKTVTVDLRKGTPLADIAPFRNNLGRGISEKLTQAGSISLDSGGDVITKSGSILDVSGGTIQYQQGLDRTTTLLGSDGRIYNIADAPIDINYIGFADGYTVTSGKWGTTTIVATPRPVLQGYTEGQSAGTISVSTPWAALQGALRAHATPGLLQRIEADLPKGGTLVIGEASQEVNGGETPDFRARNIVLSQSAPGLLQGFDSGTPAPPESRQSLQLSADLIKQGGFSSLHLFSNDTIHLSAATDLRLSPGGAFSALATSDINVAGNITILSGEVSLKSREGSVQLAPGTQIDVRGGWVNNSPLIFATADNAPLLLDGGKVTLTALKNVVVGASSQIDVSGGGWVDSNNKLTAGKGGNIQLNSTSVDNAGNMLGAVEMRGVLLGYGLFDGGTLAITAPTVRIGGAPSGNSGEYWIDPAAFRQGGFASYSLTGVNNLEIVAGTQIRPQMQNWIPDASYLIRPTGTAMSAFSRIGTLDELFRSPVSLTLASTSALSRLGLGNLTMGVGASIITDPGASVSLSARENLQVLGSIDAPAGHISLRVAPGLIIASEDDNTEGFVSNQHLLVGSSARLQAGSVAQIRRDSADGLRKGRMLDAGSVILSANKGDLILESGSLIDVSGARGEIDQFTTTGVQTIAIAGAGGEISLQAREGMAVNGSLLGKAASVPGAAAGRLSIGLDLYDRTINPNGALGGGAGIYPTQDRILTLTSDPVTGLPTAPANGTARISARQLQAGGFDQIELKSTDVIAIDGGVDLAARRSLTLDAPVLRGNPGASANLQAAYVALGNVNGKNQPGAGTLPVRDPATGNATLTVSAKLVDIRGNSLLDGFSTARYHSDGDIRFSYSLTDSTTNFTGSLKTAGNLIFQAAQLYPVTRANFTLNPEGAYAPGAVTFLSNGGSLSDTPLSAGGKLTVNATTINQAGVVRAPLGQIAFNATGGVTLQDGSVTSVSGDGKLIPFGSVQNGKSWVYQVDPATSNLISSPLAKQISLNAPAVTIASGARADLSGGGDLYAYEFVAGPGGSQDVLDSRYTAAILPAFSSTTSPSVFAPLDHQYQIGSGVSVGDTVYLSGVPGLAAGYYVLLPARYALLPGAYAISTVKGVRDMPLPVLTAALGYQDLPLGTVFAQMDGSSIVAGRTAVAGTDIADSRTSLFHVTPGSVVRTQSQYNDSFSNQFFSETAVSAGTVIPRIAADAGQLQLAATDALLLNGTIGFSTATFVVGKDAKGNAIVRDGRGGEVSVEAPYISLVDSLGPDDGTLQLQTSGLNSLGAQSLLIGGRRTTSSSGDQLTVGAERVELRNSTAATLLAPEIILAAKQQVVARSGSSIRSQGTLDNSAGALQVNGDGALLRVAEAPQPNFNRAIADPSVALLGTLIVEDQTRIASTGSVILDAAADSRIAPSARIDAHAIALSSSRVSMGDAPPDTPGAGLNLTSSLLSSLSELTELTVRSYSTIDLYGSLVLGSIDADGKPRLDSLHLDGWGLVGHGADNKLLQAASVNLTNLNQAACATVCAGDGSGSLTVLALNGDAPNSGRLFIGEGEKHIDGFSSVHIQAQKDIVATGDGKLDLANAGDLQLQSARLGTSTGADQSITNVDGRVNIDQAGSGTGAGTALADAGIGGKLAISGTQISQGGLISVRAGELALQATGAQSEDNVTLQAGSRIEASGVDKKLGGISAYAPAGKVSLQSASGNVDIKAAAGTLSAAVVDLAGATNAADGSVGGNGSDAGTLSIRAGHGSLFLDGDLRAGTAAAGKHQGTFELDVMNLGLGSYSALNRSLAAGGFTQSVDTRIRTGNILIAASDIVHAHQYKLSADQGAITVAGTIAAGGATGGRIELHANNGVTLTQGATLRADATATGEQGGKVVLGTAAGTLDLQTGSQIDVRAGTGGTGGEVLLRAPRTGSGAGDGVAVSGLNSAIQGTSATVLEAVQVYRNVDTLTAGGTNGATLGFGQIDADIASFMAHKNTILDTLGKSGDSAFHIRPGVEVLSPGNLTVDSDWNLYSASRAGDEPGMLTLRAGGDLIVKGSISDGFATAAPGAALGTGPSWSYRLVGGADLSGADPLSVTTTPDGHFILAPGKLIRTGTGDIDVAAAGDVRLGYDQATDSFTQPNASASVIYTAGTAGIAIDPDLFKLPVNRLNASLGANYTVGGGDISIQAGQDITSAPSKQLVADWLWRRGKVNTDGDGTIAANQNTTWWVNFASFQQGIGALGGGDIAVKAGNNINNLSAVIPTNGRLAGAAGSVPDPANLVIQGGGDLTLLAGGDVNSGIFQVDRGHALISAGGSLGSARAVQDTADGSSSDTTPVYTLLVLGDGKIDVRARKDATLEGVLNATTLPAARANTLGNNLNNTPTFFYTYSTTSKLNLASVAGNLTLNNNVGAILDSLPASGLTKAGFKNPNLQVYPAGLEAVALSGNVQVNETRLFPSPSGGLTLLANGNITFGGMTRIYEADPGRVANPLRPAPFLNAVGTSTIPGLSADIHLDTAALPILPLYRNDTQPVRVIAETGSIFGDSQLIILPKQAQFIAGKDISNLNLDSKNLNVADLTLLQAGRDIIFDIRQDAASNKLLGNYDRIRVGGPGLLELLAGRNLDLGNSAGVTTRGSTDDARLPAGGASIVAAAGLGSEATGGLRTPNYTAFIDRYLVAGTAQAGTHPAALTAYMRQLTSQGGLTDAQALAAFRSLPDPQKLPFVSQVLYSELRTTGLEHNLSGASYDRGYDAIQTLFPAADYAGDINLFFSQIKTEQDGNISLLAPGGSVVVGLTNPPAELGALKIDESVRPNIPAAANLGIMAFGEGAIRAFAKEHFTVNRSRILTLQGGDILLWSSDGNIDAGRGAKTASAAPPPVIQTDANGNIFVNPSGAVSGSGIGQLLTGAGTTVGSVDLLAPRGIVDAGDAGIRVAGNLNVAAVQVVGADNIRVGGVATGTPVSDSGVLAGAAAAGSSVGASVTRTVDDFGRGAASTNNSGLSNTRQLMPSFIRVEVLGLGE
ncbi:filamentous hemagglutinin family protein [Nitrosospira sp. Nsp5]|uniref:Filamentous hemagglutinin family N-terminal domain-containing protein n=1 Tax=Nitrosospira multiformis TaxID=1231 RepID=A0ABY0TB58_9PROT|nr:MULTISPECIES: filamentous haemagglutinin family protein [Nitrosospira]PTR08034.1 filamentous hemagglutinin family protein [Nitrosospira sp. Nsp5]SDQ47273.1 filamentous hemagglutinin family N-terminal domain-containing protein [Nitrosospira multiformis]